MRKFNPMTLIGLLGVCLFGVQFVARSGQVIWADRSIWWTPMTMALPLSETSDHFELYVGPDILQNLVARGALFVRDAQGREQPVTAADIRVRVNNWERVRADHLRDGVALALGLGASAALVVVGIASRASRRDAGARTGADEKPRGGS
ncbi:MAG: hypothetical protein EOL86_09200 [Deltaproteobacteria bacterium]|nr:hypothetical protein [Deltaproteobacteria bacterium]